MSKSVKTKAPVKKDLSVLLQKREEKIRALEEEKADYLDRWQRALAELDNYRKRKEKEQENIRKYALESVLYELLGVIDNFERALLHINQTNSIDALKQGVEMVYEQFKGLLKQHNVERIEAVGKGFDPRWHEAMEIMNEDARKHADDFVITEEMLPGYMLYDRLLRPAKVKVSAVKGGKKKKIKRGNEE